VCRRLRDRYHTSVVPGRSFEAPAHLRLGLCADPAATAAALFRVGLALDDLAGRQLS
jgi:aspartate/methionine/tyrosine aminotransferase